MCPGRPMPPEHARTIGGSHIRRRRRPPRRARPPPIALEAVMPAVRSPEDILTTELKQIHSAERQLTRLIPRFAKKASSERLKELLDERVEQGSTLLERLEEAFETMEVGKGKPKNAAAEGLIED